MYYPGIVGGIVMLIAAIVLSVYSFINYGFTPSANWWASTGGVFALSIVFFALTGIMSFVKTKISSVVKENVKLKQELKKLKTELTAV